MTDTKAKQTTELVLPKGYQWWALSSTSLGMFMAVINGTTLLIALPTLVRVLHMSSFLSMWVLLSYMVVQTVLVLTVGRLSDVFGRKRLYVTGFAIFTVAAIAAGLAPNGVTLLVIRGIQAIGGALVMGNATAIVTDAFPKKDLGLALGINSIVIALGQVMGPIVGGMLVTWFSWHWVFWFNVPVGIVGTLWAILQLKDVVAPNREPRLDYLGNASYMVGLVGLLIAVTAGGLIGWTSLMVWLGFGVAALGGILFARAETHAPYPLLKFSLFKSRLFAMGNLANLFIAMARGAVVLLFVFYFQGARGDSPFRAGILVIPLAIAMGITAPISGRLSDRIGARWPASLGAFLVGIGLIGFSQVISVHTSYTVMAALMVVTGIGNGLFNSPNTSSIMGSVRSHERGVAAGTRTMLLNTGNVFSIAFILAIIGSQIPQSLMMKIFAGETSSISPGGLMGFTLALKMAFLIMAIIALIAASLSWMRGHEEKGPVKLSAASRTQAS